VQTRSDSKRAYALSSGNGTVTVIDTTTDTLLCGNALVACPSVGAGANFMVYDKTLNRLYVTNPTAHTLSVLNAAVDPPAFLATIDLTAGVNPPCPVACSPVSVAPLPDGSRAYVVSYRIAATCSDPNDVPPCVVPLLTVINTSDNSVSKSIPVDVIITIPGQPTVDKPDTPELGQCDTARFRLFAAASADSTRVYVSYCDAGTTAIIRTIPNTDKDDPQPADSIVLDMPSPVSAYPPPPPPPPPAPAPQPPPQNPVFVVAGP
jgi:DNA-binding beta-propeller fold protein YncE